MKISELFNTPPKKVTIEGLEESVAGKAIVQDASFDYEAFEKKYPPVTKEEGEKMVRRTLGEIKAAASGEIAGKVLTIDSLQMVVDQETSGRGQIPNVAILDDFGYVEADPAEIEKMLDADLNGVAVEVPHPLGVHVQRHLDGTATIDIETDKAGVLSTTLETNNSWERFVFNELVSSNLRGRFVHQHKGGKAKRGSGRRYKVHVARKRSRDWSDSKFEWFSTRRKHVYTGKAFARHQANKQNPNERDDSWAVFKLQVRFGLAEPSRPIVLDPSLNITRDIHIDRM